MMCALALGALAGCGPPPPAPPSMRPVPAAPADRLRALAERYWDENAARIPWYSWGGAGMQFGGAPAENISPQSLADSLDIERRYLAEVSAIPRASLDAGGKLTYDLFRRERALAIEGFTYPLELLPVNPYDGMVQQFALMAAAAEPRALSSAAEFANWSARARSFVSWTDQAIVNMRDGMRRGVTLPRVLVEKSIPQLAALGEDGPANVLYQPLRSVAGGADDPERRRLTTAMTALLRDRILPSFRALHDFLRQEYLPRSRTSVGWSALPLGDAWYAYRVRRVAGTAASPAQLHALGMSEVDRLHGAVQAVLLEAAFPGSAQAYLEGITHDPRFSYAGADELLRAYADLKTQVAASAPALFAVFPRGDYAVRRVEPFRESTLPALSYRPAAPNGLAPATLYVNTSRLDSRPATSVASRFLAAAVPGHHYQLELQRERADLPRFRRFDAAPAFVEGWGLYAQSLGAEMGLYRDSQARFGSLLEELRCAAGLVVDTGLHAQGWTRAQALEYLQRQVPMLDVDAEETVDRAVALPADELACTVGFLKFKGLRAAAQQALGARFDLREFHSELVKDGAIPLDLLESKMQAWVSMTLAAPPKAAGAPPPEGAVQP